MKKQRSEKNISVVHVSAYEKSGGAAAAAKGLHVGLVNLGVYSSMYVGLKETEDKSVIQFDPIYTISARIYRRMRRAKMYIDGKVIEKAQNRLKDAFSIDVTQCGKQVLEQLPKSDIVNLHWVTGFIDVGEMLRITEMPVVWTLHDMNPFTGGCHYCGGCTLFRTKCHRCPQLGGKRSRDVAYRVWTRKEQVFSNVSRTRLKIVAPSRWLAETAKNSAIFSRFDVSVIPYGVDVTTFRPKNRREERKNYGIDDGAFVILFVASYQTARKGFDYLREVIKEIGKEDAITVVSVGPKIELDFPGVIHRNLGYIYSAWEMAGIYSAVDVYVIPSLEDNLPNTVLESLACGVPVVGFETGGIPDMVEMDKTGLIVKKGDIGMLRNAILGLMRNKVKRDEMSRECRKIATRRYSLEAQAELYLELYRDVKS